MDIVIVGAKDRDSTEDIADVGKLLDLLEERYGVVTILGMMSHAGIGKVVKTAASKPKDGREHRFPFVEADIRVYAKTLSPEKMSRYYTGRNAMLFEIGDIFYSFPHPQRRAVVDELIDRRVIPSGRPYKIFLPGDEIALID